MDSSPRHHAFTLIELLTVIAIIAVLMGLLFPAVNSVKVAAQKTQAKNDVTQIVTAVKAYFTEYGKYPTNDTTDKAYADNTIIDVLRNYPNSGGSRPSPDLNPRQIVFFEAPNVKDAAAPKSGVDPKTGIYYDPWGIAYSTALDADYDNVIKGGTHSYTDSNFATLNTGAIAWSFGKDKKQGTNGDKKFAGSDDVISWQ